MCVPVPYRSSEHDNRDESTTGVPLTDHTSSTTSALYQKLYASLLTGASGTEQRPPLPPELVDQIFRLADCSVPAPSLTIQINAKDDIFCAKSEGPLVRELWFYTPPLSKPMLQKLAGVRLVTESSHQGWIAGGGPESWSWWEVGIIRGSDRIRDERPEVCMAGTSQYTTGPRWEWDEPTSPVDTNDRSRFPTLLRTYVSHKHDLHEHLRIHTYSFVGPTDTCLTLSGRRFTFDSASVAVKPDAGQGNEADASCLGPLREGDRLAVFACAQHRGWECVAKWAKLDFDVYWQPA